MKQNCTQGTLTHQYYLFYAQNPRCWQRIIVSAPFENFQNVLAIPQVSTPDNNDNVCKVLPDSVRTVLNILLPCIPLFPSVTRVFLCLLEDRFGRIVEDLPRIETAEDSVEIELSKEADILHEIEIMALPILQETEIEVTSRMTSACFAIRLHGRLCVERKIPFASAGLDSQNGLKGFLNDLKLLNKLQGCQGILQLIGVVYAQLRLKSYIYEAPMIGQLHRVFYVANLRLQTIPWLVREFWSKQIAQAIADIHRKGITIGVFARHNVGLRVDGSIVLLKFTTSGKIVGAKLQADDLMPPELQRTHDTLPQQMFNARTDIYQFALYLWLLAAHRANTVGARCSRYGCMSVPRYQCTANHANPVHLPPCLGNIPSYFSDVITQCRSENPKARPTARRIAENLSSHNSLKVCPRDTLELLETYNDDPTFGVHCAECGARASVLHYHCYVCDFGDFDLCPHCVELQKIHCYVPDHRLVKRKKKNGGFVNVSWHWTYLYNRSPIGTLARFHVTAV